MASDEQNKKMVILLRKNLSKFLPGRTAWPTPSRPRFEPFQKSPNVGLKSHFHSFLACQ